MSCCSLFSLLRKRRAPRLCIPIQVALLLESKDVILVRDARVVAHRVSHHFPQRGLSRELERSVLGTGRVRRGSAHTHAVQIRGAQLAARWFCSESRTCVLRVLCYVLLPWELPQLPGSVRNNVSIFSLAPSAEQGRTGSMCSNTSCHLSLFTCLQHWFNRNSQAGVSLGFPQAEYPAGYFV